MEKVFEFKSQGGLFPHTHMIKISDIDIQNPTEQGLTLRTSTEYSLIFKHSHEVKITKDELIAIKSGQEVTVYDTDKRRHSFAVKI